ncbi:MAG: hypothetical protein FLDDKLPJ_00491 [Phycisphaerae bacterium]|nr:hypothetical protein [Phycisphaerae bacterium]
MSASTVIKAGQAGVILKRLSGVDLADHLRQADAVVAEARRRAALLLEEARVEAEERREAARREGFAAGLEEGRREGLRQGREASFAEGVARFEREHAGIVSALRGAFEGFEAEKERLLRDAGRDMLSFAVEAARRLTFAVGTAGPESAQANLERALQLAGSATDVTVHVHPKDAEALRTYAESEAVRMQGFSHVRVATDEGIAPGGCRVTWGCSEVDATLETQVGQLTALLLGTE